MRNRKVIRKHIFEGREARINKLVLEALLYGEKSQKKLSMYIATKKAKDSLAKPKEKQWRSVQPTLSGFRRSAFLTVKTFNAVMFSLIVASLYPCFCI